MSFYSMFFFFFFFFKQKTAYEMRISDWSSDVCSSDLTFDEFRAKGIEVACMSVNDPFVMQAWGQSQHAPEGLLMLADGNGEFARALGLEMDASSFGMGMRAKRFSLSAEDGVARIVKVRAPAQFRGSSAGHMPGPLSLTHDPP